MTPCRAAVLLFFAPLAFGCLVGYAIANSLIVALEDARRERRERVTQVAADTAIDICRIPADYSFEVN